MGVRLVRAYSPKVWLAMRHGLRVTVCESEHYRSFAYSALASFRITPDGLAVSAELVRLLRMDYSRMTLAWELKSLAPGRPALNQECTEPLV